ncbi:MAG: Asp-tRNA(Asn)/Glu-tRNA(Gln) amidotransferase subunit GatA, partial [Oscillospiraceae bacterium]|nr:Asp-tRNA(Asn)/Glu-tRNA(Gln) amidotransferase subunit GatA [Oscillospiraceae bacterium]
MGNELVKLSVSALSAALSSGEIAAEEAAKSYLDQISASDDAVGAYITVTADEALRKAREVDQKRKAGGWLPPLAGVPFGVKDNICTKNVLTTCASKMLHNFVPPYDAFVMKRLAEQDAVMLGKLNMDEFAMGSTTENSYYKVTRNPRNLERVPGGSSGGPAAAVAAFEAAYGLGSDTGGSIRQPAAFCGIVGVKPTYGTVSRNGLIAFASSLDQIGPLTRSVEDAALVLEAIMGHDEKDSTSVDRTYDGFVGDLKKGVAGMKIALPKEYFAKGLAPEIKEAILAAAKTFEGLGAVISEVSLPSLAYALPAYYVISSAEASSNLARFDGVKYGYRAENCADIDDLYRTTRSQGFGPEVKRRILLGTFALSSGYYDAYYKKALQVRTLVMRDFQRIFEQNDAVLSPVAPTTAYKIGEKTHNPLEMYMGDVYTVPVNIAGLPS